MAKKVTVTLVDDFDGEGAADAAIAVEVDHVGMRFVRGGCGPLC